MAFMREWFFRQSAAHNLKFIEYTVEDTKPLHSSSNARGRLIYSEYMFQIYKKVQTLKEEEIDTEAIKGLSFADFQQLLDKLLSD